MKPHSLRIFRSVKHSAPGTEPKRDVRIITILALVLVSLLSAGCGDSSGTNTNSGAGLNNDPVAQQQYGGSYRGGTASGDTQKGQAFAQWVLDQDPQRQYITDAVVRQEQTLGVKVQPKVTKADVQSLLQALIEGMAGTFPGKSLKASAFYQSGDKLAEANYDINTRRVDVQFVR